MIFQGSRPPANPFGSAHVWPRLLSILSGDSVVVVDSLFVDALIVCRNFVFDPCLVM